MVLEKLGSALRKALSSIASAVFIDKGQIEAIVNELKRALIEADVDVHLVFELCEKIKKQAISEKSPLEKKEQLIKLIHDEIVNILGKEKYELVIDKTKKPCYMMMLGLYGAGKTTAISKLSLYYSKRGYGCAMLGLDVHRPAAPEQLEQLAEKVKVPCFINKTEKNPLKIFKEHESKLKKYDLVFVDTAGRDALDNELIKEIKDLSNAIKPQQIILVMPADIGQSAKKQATEFQKACNVTGVIITRLDGTAKGGGALAACAATGAKVLFIGTGEKPGDLEAFNPTAFAGRLLGMGDLQALMEKAKDAIEEKEREKIEKSLEQGKFTLDDFYNQLKAMQNMGPLGKIAQLIPGLGGMKMPTEMLDMQEGKMKKWGYAIQSMTKQEKEDPELLKKETSRIQRIAKGSGLNASDIRDLIKQWDLMKDLVGKGMSKKMEGLDMEKLGDMKGMNAGSLAGMLGGKKLRKLAKRFKGKMPF